jgi:hypothetical protein
VKELEQALADAVLKATNAAEVAGIFMAEQLPDVAQQFIKYKFLEAVIWSSVWPFLALMMLIASAICFRKCARPDDYVICTAICLGFALLFASNALSDIQTALMAHYAPKVLLIQWASDLTK